MYNIMIGRVWLEESDLTPSELRVIACALNANGANADGGDSPKSQPDLATDGALADHRATVLNNSTSSDNTPVDYLGTPEPIESCGMLIDFDFMRDTSDSGHMASVGVHSAIFFLLSSHFYRELCLTWQLKH